MKLSKKNSSTQAAIRKRLRRGLPLAGLLGSILAMSGCDRATIVDTVGKVPAGDVPEMTSESNGTVETAEVFGEGQITQGSSESQGESPTDTTGTSQSGAPSNGEDHPVLMGKPAPSKSDNGPSERQGAQSSTAQQEPSNLRDTAKGEKRPRIIMGLVEATQESDK